MNLQRIPVDKLKPAKYNPRKDLKPGDPAYEKIRRSLTDFGYVDPIIWNDVTGNIVGGHQRFKVLTSEGATELQCVVVHIEKPEDEKALNIVLNKVTGEWEPVALADLLQNLQSANYDLDSTGFDAAEIDELFSKVYDKNVKDDDAEIDPDAIHPFVPRRPLVPRAASHALRRRHMRGRPEPPHGGCEGKPRSDGPAVQCIL